MKANKKMIITLVATLIVVLIARYFYFNISGTKISESILSGSIDEIKIVKTYETSEKSEIIEQAVLNDEQTKLLISLIESTKFRRIVSKSVPYYDKDRYVITADTSEGTIRFNLESYGGEFLLLDSMDGILPPKHWKLRIKNDEWKNTLERILELSD